MVRFCYIKQVASEAARKQALMVRWSSGDKVFQLQRQLARIALNYPAIGSIAVDGVYGQHTADAVKNFQQIFNLPATGVTDYKTWYKISQIYVGVTKIAENV